MQKNVFEDLLRAAKTHMVWNVKIVIGQTDTVPAHLVYQVFPHNDDLLAAVLDPDEENIAGHLKFLKTERLPNVMSLVPHLSKACKSTLCISKLN